MLVITCYNSNDLELKILISTLRFKIGLNRMPKTNLDKTFEAHKCVDGMHKPCN